MNSNISIVVVTYNSAKIIKSFLSQPTLRKESDIIIVDNASSDKTIEIIKKIMPSVSLLSLKKNIGYGSAVNKGIKIIKNQFVLVMNPDIFFSSNFFFELKKSIRKDWSWGMLAPTILKKTDFIRPPTSQFTLKKDTKRNLYNQKVKFISGACFLIEPKKLPFKKIFDENIFMFYEDNDLSKKISLLNLDNFILKECFVYHEGENSSGSSLDIMKIKNVHYGWSECYFNQKYNPRYKSYLVNIFSIFKYIKRVCLYGIFLNKKRFLISWFRLLGKLEFLRGKNSRQIF
jgi:N-acetylglucosaminyl-diphospho-decaprenol L-rhamnosyltransferase